MACYEPLEAWQDEDGSIRFHNQGGRPLLLPCGKCIGCRLRRAESWTVRLMHEAQMHRLHCFVTLTYKVNPIGLQYSDFQLFMRRLRHNIKPAKVRYFVAGEYGSSGNRPHWHAMLFGVDFVQHDGRVFSESKGHKVYESPSLTELWSHGFCTVGSVTPASCAYTAKYCLKSAGGLTETVDLKTGELYELMGEFTRGSLKPPIGVPWYQKYASDLFSDDVAVTNDGRSRSVPRIYLERLKVSNPLLYEDIKYRRYLRSKESEGTPERLAARAACAAARIAHFSRESL